VPVVPILTVSLFSPLSPDFAAWPVMAQSTDIETFLGEDLLAWLLLAIGAALALGTVLALLRPPPHDATGDDDDAMQRPPLARSLVMIGIGLVAALWGAASLFG
jgi:hypothetical protein